MLTINTALCSFGMSGKLFHAPFIHLHPGYNLYAVWERSKNLAQEAYPGIKTYRTYEDLLADPAIDLVVVNTPNTTHYDYAYQALAAGKHIIVEKPFTVTVQQAQTLQQLAAEKGKVVAVYQNRRWDSDFSTVRKVVHEKLLGDLVEAEFHYDRYNPVLSPKPHKEAPVQGTGIVYDLGPHLIDQALSLFGMPEKLFADTAKLRPNSLVDDYMEILLWYGNLRVRLKSGYLVREPQAAYTLHGTLGSFIKTRADEQEACLQNGETPNAANWGTEPDSQQGLLHTVINGRVVRQTIPTLSGNYMHYFQQVYQAITQNKPAPVTVQDGINTIKIIEAVYRSVAANAVVQL
jgi:predicted dehydrogenase